MADGYGLDAAGMAKAAADVDKVHENVVTDLRSVHSGLEPLRGAWRGDAATAFGKLMDQWKLETNNLSTALKGIGETLKEQAGGYILQEKENSAKMSKIEAELNI